MLVKDLIAMLQQHPPDLRVVVDGYPPGALEYDDPLPPQPIQLTGGWGKYSALPEGQTCDALRISQHEVLEDDEF